MFAFRAVSVAYIIFLVGYGIIKGGKAKSFRDFAGTVAEPPVWIITASMCASFIGGGFSLGNAERAYSEGIANTLLLLGFSVGQLVVGLWLAPKFAKFRDVATVGGIIGKAFGQNARILCGVLSALFAAGVLGAQINAIGIVAGYLFALPTRLCSVIGFAVLVLYSTFGGLKASLKSDTIQIAVLAVGLPLALFAALSKIGGVAKLFAALPPTHLNPLTTFTPLGFVSLLLTFALGEMLCPPSVQRMLLSKAPARTRSATVLSSVISVPFFAVTGMIGLCALVLGTTNTATFAMPSMIGGVLGLPLGAIVCAAMLCVYLSSGGAFLNSCASALCEDVIGAARKKPLDDAHHLKLVRIINLVCGIIALVVAISFDNVLSILVLSYSFWAPVVLVPLVLALSGRRYTATAFMRAAAVSASVLIVWRVLGEPFGISPIIIGFLANLFAFGIFKNKG